MAEITRESIKHLHDEIVHFLNQPRPDDPVAAALVDAEKDRFVDVVHPSIPKDSLGLPLSAGDTLWSSLSAAECESLERDLTTIRNTLRRLVRPAPLDPHSMMYGGHAGNAAIWVLMSYALLLTVVLGFIVIKLWPAATGPNPETQPSATATELEHNAEELLQAVRFAREKRDRAAELQDKARDRQAQAEDADRGANNDADEAADRDDDSAGDNSDNDDKGDAIGAPADAERKAVEALDQQAALANQSAVTAEIQMRMVALMTGRVLTVNAAPSEETVLWTVVLLGALGGTLRLLSSLVRYVGNRQLTGSWFLYYLAMPFQGALLASIVYMLLRVGILAPSVSGDSGTAHLNLISVYAFSALTGLFSNQAMVKLRDIFEEVFRPKKDEQKDPLSANSPNTAPSPPTPPPAPPTPAQSPPPPPQAPPEPGPNAGQASA